MIQALIQKLKNHPHPESIFYSIEFLIGGAFLLIIGWMRPRPPESGFKVRESDLPKAKSSSNPSALANAKIQMNRPLQLEGIRITGAPHEILGVVPNATPEEIQKAYRELMKRYHPDRVGRQGSREWNDAQKISEAINSAKDQMLKRARRV